MEHRRPYPGAPRTIDVWCEARSHDPVLIGQLTSYRSGGSSETWTVTGPHVATEQLMRRDEGHARREVLSLAGRVAERHHLLCPRCGFDVVAGDRLGRGRPGFRALQETRAWDRIDAQSWVASRRTDVALSQVADAGVSRLSLSGVARILGLVTE